MSKRKVMSIIGLGLIALLILFLFLPYAKMGYDGSANFWDSLKLLSGEEVAIIYLIELLLAILLLILQVCGVLKDTKIAMIPIGFVFTISLGLFFFAMNNDRLEYLEFGLYMNIILSIAIMVILGIGGLLSNDKKPKYGYAPRPVGYDPETGKPIYEAPKTIVGYDPQTGAPIYK